MLVNLTCGRNPWKRASFEDSTFRAFMKDPKFLRTILPVSTELDAILRRMFEFNPANRATIHEIREMILRCSSFTATKSAVATPLSSPPFSPVDYSRDAAYNAYYRLLRYPSLLLSPAQPTPHHPSSTLPHLEALTRTTTLSSPRVHLLHPHPRHLRTNTFPLLRFPNFLPEYRSLNNNTFLSPLPIRGSSHSSRRPTWSSMCPSSLL